MDRTRIAFIALDAFPFDRVDTGLTPNLASLASQGAYARGGGAAVLSASTYPNFASLVTGVSPEVHGIFTGKSWAGGELVPAWKAGPASPTLFDDCRARGRRSVAVFGDQHLVGVCGAREADSHWPPEGRLPEDAPRGALGYGADRAVVTALGALELESADFLFVQLDEIDTARHLHGPWGEEVREQCRATDAALGQIVEQLRSRWTQTIVFVVSDHDHEAVDSGSVDLAQYVADQGLDLVVDHDGTAAVVSGMVDRDTLLAFPGVIDACDLGASMVARGRLASWPWLRVVTLWCRLWRIDFCGHRRPARPGRPGLEKFWSWLERSGLSQSARVRRYSSTTVPNPTKRARLMRAWPIETSSRCGSSRKRIRLSRSRSCPALIPSPSS